ncbi:MAG: hypothetical protein QOI70_746, partial [Microbacteriaceae bacterium]|nr:hypothetical protein [Microbacteriaceae bacterium]
GGGVDQEGWAAKHRDHDDYPANYDNIHAETIGHASAHAAEPAGTTGNVDRPHPLKESVRRQGVGGWLVARGLCVARIRHTLIVPVRVVLALWGMTLRAP